jgi:thiamine biosynthesis protein ThiS
MEITTSTMTIYLNGISHPIETVVTLSELLENLGFSGKPVVVELNEQAIFPRDYPTVLIVEGARVEIVTLAAGG